MATPDLTQGLHGSRGLCQGTNDPDAGAGYAALALPDTYFDDDIGAKIKSLGFSQVNFAKVIGVTPRCVSMWVTRERKTPAYALKFAEALREINRLRDIVLGKRII